MKSFFKILCLLIIAFSNNKLFSQTEIDSLYLFPDTTEFNEQTITVTGDITNLAVRFNTEWDKYEIFKIGVMIPSGISENEIITYNISTGNSPEQNIIYRGNFNATINYPTWQYVDISSPVQMLGINSFYISGFVLYVSAISNYSQTLLYNNEFQYNITRDEWSELIDIYFAIKVFIRKSLTDIEEDNLNENGFYLAQNYPNPFNPTTNITYQLISNSIVNLKIVDILGQDITTLIDNKIEQKGNHTLKFDASKYRLSSGIYFMEINVIDIEHQKTEYHNVIKMLYLR